MTAFFTNGSGALDSGPQMIAAHLARPAFCLPANIILQTDNTVLNLVTQNTSPLAPTTISVNGGNTIMGGQQFAVSWSAVSDDFTPTAQLQFHVLRSLNGGSWQNVAVVNGLQTSITDSIANGAAANVRYAVFAHDGYARSINQIESPVVQVITNFAPTIPPNIFVTPTIPFRGETVNVTWGASTDQDGNLVGYKLERSIDGGGWTQIFQGSGRAFTDTIGQWQTVRYRVRAYDSFDAHSGYRTSAVFNPQDPVAITITVQPGSFIQDGATLTGDADMTLLYAISNNFDPNMQQEYVLQLFIDNRELDTRSGLIPNGLYSFELSKSAWQTIRNGARALILIVGDASGNTVSKNINFTKAVFQAILQSDPIFVDVGNGDIIKKFLVNIQGNFPSGSALTVKVTNNAMDDTPVWHILSPAELNSNDFESFVNDVVQNGNYFAIRVEADRGTAGTDCWIDQISGIAGQSFISVIGGDTIQLQVQLAALEQALQEGLQGLLKFQGAVSTYSNLPTDPNPWDLWQADDTGAEWYWNGVRWKQLDFTISVDMTPTENSINPVSSGGAFDAIASLSSRIDAIESIISNTAMALDPTIQS